MCTEEEIRIVLGMIKYYLIRENKFQQNHARYIMLCRRLMLLDIGLCWLIFEFSSFH